MSTPRRHTHLDQLSLDLPESSRPLQFRLDARTRRLGLASIARIRQEAAARQARRQATTSHAATSHAATSHAA